jgi:capsular exopolysaccharide synthesis family protein
MELRDYARMLRRGWATILLVTVLAVGLAGLYLVLAPKRYDATSVLFVSANAPTSIDDLQQGAVFSSSAVVTYAEIIDSVTVLGQVSTELRPQLSVDELAAMLNVTVRPETTLIDVVASGPDPRQVAAVADATAASAARIIPGLETAADGRPLVRVQQIRRAVEPVTAASPNVKRVLAIGGLVGLCAGLALAITGQMLDTRIRRPEDVAEITDTPVLALLPPVERGPQRGPQVLADPSGPVGEAFRTLRTNLPPPDSPDRRSLLFTAVSDERDGAHVPANLAWSLALAGRRVLLVDLDLRRSAVGEAVGLPPGPGLADVLLGRTDLRKVIHNAGNPRVRVLLSGTSQPTSADLLSSLMIGGLMRWMEQEHDYVILHAPPLLAYTDAAAVSGAIGGTFVTVAVGHTKGHELTSALNTLANVRVEPLGLVLTGVRRSGGPGRVTRAEPVRPESPSTRRPPREHRTQTA